MMKLLIVLAGLLSCVAAEEKISEQDQIYIMSGILAAVCLFLTIATIANSVLLIKLQTKVAVLQVSGAQAVKALSDQPKRDAGPRSDDASVYSRPEDPYRRTPPRENFRMERRNNGPFPMAKPLPGIASAAGRFNPENYYSEERLIDGPVPPARPPRPGPSNYY